MSTPRPAPTRRAALHTLGALGALGGLWLGLAMRPAHAQSLALPLSDSLQAELARALAARQPLVVLVSLHRCPWCEQVRRHYLAPMHAQEGLPVVQVDMRSPRPTRSVDGAPITHDEQVRAWGVKVAPTVLFLGPGGHELAERLVGGATDFYAAYLERRLAQARQALAPS